MLNNQNKSTKYVKLLQKNLLKKITDKIIKISRTTPKSISGTVTNEGKSFGFDREIPKERYISPEKSQQIFDDLCLI